ncbi:23096_t:CDS:2, partial [Racocetra persica]
LKDNEVDCETACLDEVFDLSQVYTSTILHEFQNQIVSIWEQPILYSTRTSNNDNENQLSATWNLISSFDICKFSNKEIEIAQSHLKERQHYAKQLNSNHLIVKNLVTKAKKGRSQRIQCFLSSIKINQQSVKSRSNRYKHCGVQGHNIRSCEKKQDNSKSEDDNSELENNNTESEDDNTESEDNNFRLEDNNIENDSKNLTKRQRLKRANKYTCCGKQGYNIRSCVKKLKNNET